VHATVEEELFYPAVREVITSKVLIDHAEQEHAQAKQMIGQIQANLNNSLARDPAIQTLQAAVLQHVQVEESQIFSEVQASNLDLEDLGTQAEARKNELMSAS
jgi:hemerythrin-like domain-containing protein